MNKTTIKAKIRELTGLSIQLGKLAYATTSQNEAAKLYDASNYCDQAIKELQRFLDI